MELRRGTNGHATRAWLARAIFTLDRRLCQHQGIYEYSAHPQCFFRLEVAPADETLCLSDRTFIKQGCPILKLHLWNERVPQMGRQGASIAWARRASHAVEISLRELARCLDSNTRWRGITAICADMRLADGQENTQLLRIVARYGFEGSGTETQSQSHGLRRVGETILACMLVLAANPAALRFETLHRQSVRIYLSRATLQRRYGTTAQASSRVAQPADAGSRRVAQWVGGRNGRLPHGASALQGDNRQRAD